MIPRSISYLAIDEGDDVIIVIKFSLNFFTK